MMISVSSISCSPQPTFQETYSKKSKLRARILAVCSSCSPREFVQLSTASLPPRPGSPSIPASRPRRFGRPPSCGGQPRVTVIVARQFPSTRQQLLSWCDYATSIDSPGMPSGSIDRSGFCPPSVARMCRRREADRTGGRAGHSREPKCPARDWGCAGSQVDGRDSPVVRAAQAQHRAMNRVRSRVPKWYRRRVRARKRKRVARLNDRGDEGVGCS